MTERSLDMTTDMYVDVQRPDSTANVARCPLGVFDVRDVTGLKSRFHVCYCDKIIAALISGKLPLSAAHYILYTFNLSVNDS